MSEPVVLSWSGGKDSALALHSLRRDSGFEVRALLTTLAFDFRRVSHHGVREVLLDRQAHEIGIPLHKIYLTADCDNAEYEKAMAGACHGFQRQGIRAVAFGDIFLEDLRAYRERRLAEVGLGAVFPLWRRDTSELARTFIALGFRARLSCVDGKKLDRSFAGRAFDSRLLDDLGRVRVPRDTMDKADAPVGSDRPSSPPCGPSPARTGVGSSKTESREIGIDPCGENGEFHSFVWNGPVFKNPIDITVGEVVKRDSRFFADLLPTDVGDSSHTRACGHSVRTNQERSR